MKASLLSRCRFSGSRNARGQSRQGGRVAWSGVYDGTLSGETAGLAGEVFRSGDSVHRVVCVRHARRVAPGDETMVSV